MRFLIGILVFVISMMGYLNMFRRYFKLPLELLLPIIFTIISIIVFISGILNMLKIMCLLLYIVGILIFVYDLYKHRIILHKYFTVNCFIILLLMFYYSVICKNMHVMHYDNFTHWSLIVKSIFINNAFPNFKDYLIGFKGYQPGSACFIYYLSLLIGKNEGSMIIAQNYLLIAFYFPLLCFTNSKNRLGSIFLKILVISGYLFILYNNVNFNELLVDTLVSTVGICMCVTLYYFKNDLKKQFMFALPYCIYILLIKNIGIVLVGMVCIYYFIYGILNKKIKEGIEYAILTGAFSIIVFFMWTRHVSYVFDISAIETAHTLSIRHLFLGLKGTNIKIINDFIPIYINRFLDLNNIINKYMISIDIVVLMVTILYKKYRKILIKCLILINLIYLFYHFVLGIMYILSFSWDEMAILAGYNRYMLTIIHVIIGIVLMIIIDISNKEIRHYRRKTLILLSILITICLMVNYNYSMNKNLKLLYGDYGYKNSMPYQFDKALNTDFFLGDSFSFYYIYKPNFTELEGGYGRFVAKYKLYSENYKLVDNIDKINELNEENTKKYNKKIIILENDDDIDNYLKKNNYKRVRKNFYIKQLDRGD